MKILYNNIYSSGEVNVSFSELNEKVKITPEGLVLKIENQEDEYLTVESLEMALDSFERLKDAYGNLRSDDGEESEFDLSGSC